MRPGQTEIDWIYETVAEFCFEHLGFSSFDEVDRVTIPEFLMMTKTQARKNVDREYIIHKAAWLSAVARATKKDGKMVYSRFEKFFNYKKAMASIEKSQMSDRGKRIAEYRKKRLEGEM